MLMIASSNAYTKELQKNKKLQELLFDLSLLIQIDYSLPGERLIIKTKLRKKYFH